VETAQMSINRQMDQQNVMYTYKGVLLNHRKNDAGYHSVDESQKHAK
jgi:hypothetical protein